MSYLLINCTNLKFSWEVVVGVVAVFSSISIYFFTNRKSRRLETMKYMSEVRKEISEIKKQSYNTKEQPEIRQKLEYISTAVNIGTFEYKVVKRLSGSWLCQIIKESGILNRNEMEYTESKKLYRRLKGINRNASRILFSFAFLFLLTIGFNSTAFGQIINVPADYPTIQQGIDAAVDGDTVLVQPGIYYEHVFFDSFDKSIILSSLFLITNDTSYISQTIIDGSSYGLPCVKIHGCEKIEIAGFTIQNGFTASDGYGAAMDVRGSNAEIHNLRIIDNECIPGSGGTVCFRYGNVSMRNIEFVNNSGYGQCIVNDWRTKSTNLRNIRLKNNTCGGTYCIVNTEGVSTTYENILISDDNESSGGIYVNGGGSINLINITIKNDQLNTGVYIRNRQLNIINCIICNCLNNSIYCEGGLTYIDHSIIDGGEDEIWTPYPGALQYGGNNIDTIPEFVDPDNGNYQLADNCVGIGAGTLQIVMAEDTLIAPSFDINSNPRPMPFGSNPDIGAFENVLGAPANSVGQPSIALATNITDTSFTANWVTPTNGSAPYGYILDVATDLPFSSILPLYDSLDVGNVLSYDVTGLTPETEYFYRVRSYGEYGTSINSGTMNVITTQSINEHLFINYQAVLRNQEGIILSDTSVSIQFSIQDKELPNIDEYSEEHTLVTNQFGLLNCKIGNGNVTSGNFGDLSWQDKYYQLSINLIDNTGSIITLGAEPISYTPYSMHSLTTADTTFNTLTITSGNLHFSQPNTGMILKSPDGNCWKVTIDNSGNLTSVQVTCEN